MKSKITHNLCGLRKGVRLGEDMAVKKICTNENVYKIVPGFELNSYKVGQGINKQNQSYEKHLRIHQHPLAGTTL